MEVGNMATSSILKNVVLNDNESTKMFMDAIDESEHIIVEDDESSFECKEVRKSKIQVEFDKTRKRKLKKGQSN